MYLEAFTVREWVLLGFVLVEFGLICFAIHRVRIISQELLQSQDKKHIKTKHPPIG